MNHTSDLLDFEKILSGRSILVTGHTGFTGGWLALWLHSIGCKVSGIALRPITEPNLFEAADIENNVASQIGDICDYATVEGGLAGARPSVVFHLAAQPLVSKSFEAPLKTFATNVIGTANLLEAARSTAGVEAFVCVTTDKVYLDRGWAWGYREIDRLGGKDPYSASKACSELVANCYQETMAARGNGLKIATARGGNIVGGGDWSEDRLVPDLVRAILLSEPLTLRNPDAVRPWQHVLALIHGYLLLASKLLSSSRGIDNSWNFGPSSSDARRVSDIVELLCEHWRRPEIRYQKGSFPETSFLHLDSAKSNSLLSWRTQLSFKETARLTTDWYRDYYANPSDAKALTLQQIEDYRRSLRSRE